MPITRLADVIQPEIFTPYTVQATMEKSELIQSGIIQNDAEFNTLAGGANTLINMPFWNDLENIESQVMKDQGDMAVSKITSNKDMARKQARTQAWGANGLSALLSGADPAGAIASRVSAYWARDMQRNLLATLSGVFKSSSMSAKVHDITGRDADAGTINARTFIDATQLMGDAKDSLTGVMMNSAVEAELVKQDLIEYAPQSEQGRPIGYFLGKRVIVDDAMPFDTNTGQSEVYIFGQGAIALGNGSHPGIVETEIVRNGMSYSGEENLVNRRIFILHPRGVAWNEGSIADVFPTNAELNVGARWTRVYEPKAVRIVKFRFNTVPQAPSTPPTPPAGE
ncbi:major capsid protein 13 [Cytobacillus horneckiae]|uniref:major capsid protein n=1 Tax=Cytobacillus horneckiae TaxID=549687 RepID=UPI0019D1E38D|nr:major capsid protein [Cytobacillus horneckiae]MBN6886239.1 coat protein [Cytobacillus horneckiae]